MKVQKNFRLNNDTCEQLSFMADSLNVSQADILENALFAFTAFYDAMVKEELKGKEQVSRAVAVGTYAVDYYEIARQMQSVK